MKVTVPQDCYLADVGDGTGDYVTKGDVIDVPQTVARSLIEQGWHKSTAKESKKPHPVAAAARSAKSAAVKATEAASAATNKTREV